jgi:hypothetical protein
VGEIIPIHYEIIVNNDTIAFIYKPIACHSYNVLNMHGQKVKIATIDTMLSFYLAFLYADRPYYNEFLDRILCMSKFLFDVQQKNRLEQKGLLKRFSITCYGHQESVEEMRAHKAEMYKKLKASKNKAEFEDWFLNYKPDEIKSRNKGELASNDGKETYFTNSKTLKKRSTTKSTTNKNKNKNKNKKRGYFFMYGNKTKKNK